MSVILHNYFRSSTSIRVRIALAIKGVDYQYSSYALLNEEHKSPEFLKLNPQGLVPTLETPQGIISQSMAILEYLDEVHPSPALLPVTPIEKARVRSLAQVVAMDIHPVNNLRILQYIRSEFNADDATVKSWFQQWANVGFSALEARLSREPETGRFCHGNNVSLADICLVSQAINNKRFEVALGAYPTIERIVNACLKMPAFVAGLPENQPDAIG
ncbi:MAG: maleylacetoacetate isomerase [Granulosicoccus sp.]